MWREWIGIGRGHGETKRGGLLTWAASVGQVRVSVCLHVAPRIDFVGVGRWTLRAGDEGAHILLFSVNWDNRANMVIS